jgi:hypothetical protein
MTKIMVCSLFVFGAFAAYAQSVKKDEVPVAVKAAFAKKYPEVRTVKWGREDGNFEAEFEVNKTAHSALMDADGNLLESEVSIKTSELPQAVSEYVAKNYKVIIKEAARITDVAGKITYEAEVGGKDLIFDEKGVFVKEMK